MTYTKLPSSEQALMLVVDDIPMNLQVLSNIFYDMGVEIGFATSGKQAIEAVKHNPPDVILLDISMPEMDGYEVCRILKSQDQTKDIPVIFITARSQAEDIVKGFEVGAVDYVTKPYNHAELISRVFNHIALKQSRDLIEKQNKELQELNATKDKFFSIIAHDLKNPFNTLLGFSELLVIKYPAMEVEKVQRFHKLIHKAAQNGIELLDNLLQWASSQTGRLAWNPTHFDLRLTVVQTVELLQPNAHSKGIEIVSEISEPHTLFGDTNMITTILRNLISNALKFSEQGGKVIIRAKKTNITNLSFGIPTIDEYTEIQIVDNGVGMSEHDLAKLFKIEVHHSTIGTDGEHGTGLGLIICKEFVEKHGGKIHVQSQVGVGTTFFVAIPNPTKPHKIAK